MDTREWEAAAVTKRGSWWPDYVDWLSSRSGENLHDHCSFGIGVVLRVLPVLASELPFGALVQLTIGYVVAQPVAEEQHALNLMLLLLEKSD